jgi:hypothetical protein
MFRNLKATMLASVAVIALSALGASVAQASHFNAPGSVGTIEISSQKDGTAKNAHHVFDIENALGTVQRSITCEEAVATGSAAAPKTEEVRVTIDFRGNCQFIGQTVTVEEGACDFKFTASGQVHIQTDPGLTGECKHGGNPITFATPNCKVEVGEQTVNGVVYDNTTLNGKKTITLTANNLTGVTYNAQGTDCPFGTTTNGKYTTGNTYVLGSQSGTQVDVEWT